MTGELRYMIPRSVELRLGEENLSVCQFSKGFETIIGAPGAPCQCINASVAGHELAENENFVDKYDSKHLVEQQQR